MKRMLLKRITLWDEANPLNGSATDILIEDGTIVEIVPSDEKQWDDEIPVVLENAHISGGWYDRAMFLTSNDLSFLSKYSQKTGFKKISLIHFPELIQGVYKQSISELTIEHIIPLFFDDKHPVDIRELDWAAGWALFLDDPLDAIANLLEELRIANKPLVIFPFERENPGLYSVDYSTENLWKGIHGIRPELLQAKLSTLTQLLSSLNLLVLSPFIVPEASNLIPLLSLVPSQDSDGFPTKQLPPYSPQLVEQIRDLGNYGQHVIGVASCNWLNAKPQNFPWDIRSPKVFDIQRVKKAINFLFKHLTINIAVQLLTCENISKTLEHNTIFKLSESKDDISFPDLH